MSESEILPVFKSHNSLGRSILTLNDADEEEDGNHTKSIIQICKEEKIKKLLLVEDTMCGFLQAYLNCEKHKISLCFGLRLDICPDMNEKSEDSLSETSKIILIAKNRAGYKKLIKIYSTASTIGKYYRPRIDFGYLQEFVDDSFDIAFPFYDSFIYRNLMYSSMSVPVLSGKKPIFFIEDNDLPFDNLVKKSVASYADAEGHSILNTKSIYYHKREDFKAYLTFRCIHNRSSLEKPRLDHMTSSEYCVESWKEQNGTSR